MTTTVTVTGENGLDCATQLRNFFIGLQMANSLAAPEQAKAGVMAEKVAKEAAKPVVTDDEEEELPAKKPVAKEVVVEDDEEEEAPAPKKAAAKRAPVKKAAVEEEEEEEEEETPKAKKTDGKTSASTEPLKDDGSDQPPTVDGCRIMVRRVARAHDTGYAQAVLSEFGVDGATKIPPKKFQAFIDRCQEVIDDPDLIDVSAE